MPETRSLNARPDADHHAALALLGAGTPLLDVRAPVEFAQGKMPQSVNLPILNDDERREVGTAYKQHGGETAERLGHTLVAGEVKAGRVAAWVEHANTHPDVHVMCWRGGQRSAIAQAWLREAGIDRPRVSGGYKALRQACLQTFEAVAHEPDGRPWHIVGGRTGVRKTVLIKSLASALDLEGLAHHRGSAFGGYPTGQPTPATFENALACALLGHADAQLVLEDESRTIGRLALPEAVHARMQHSPLVLIESTLADRAAHIEREYVHDELAAGTDPAVLCARYVGALDRISKRLGGLRHGAILAPLEAAFAAPYDADAHAVWIAALLSDYYDPMYDYQLEKKTERIVFRGDYDSVRDYLSALPS